jgi:hypothetical protein
MAIFNSFLYVYQRVDLLQHPINPFSVAEQIVQIG